jgi:hypothetical protein
LIYEGFSVVVVRSHHYEYNSQFVLDAQTGEVVFGFVDDTIFRRVDGVLEQTTAESTIRYLEFVPGERPLYFYHTAEDNISHLIDLETGDVFAELPGRLEFNEAGTKAIYFESKRGMMFDALIGETQELITFDSEQVNCLEN